MGGGGRIVAIAAPALRAELAAALPEAHVRGFDGPLDAIWAAARDGCDAILLQLHAVPEATELLRALRRAAPQAAIVGLCVAVDEPLARAALQEGLDDYLLLPLDAGAARRMLASVLSGRAEAPTSEAPDVVPRGEYEALRAALDSQIAEAARWRRLALHDEATGLLNRRGFDEALESAIEQAASRRRPLTVLLLEVHELAAFAARIGLAAADELVQEIGALLRRCTRSDDIVARIGPATFAIALTHLTPPRTAGSEPPRDAAAFGRRIREAAAAGRPRWLGPSAASPVSIHAGLVTFPWHGLTASQVLAAADQSLRLAQRDPDSGVLLTGRDATRSPQT